MRFMHLADLHIGKRVNGFSMLEDQQYILEQVLAVLDEQEVDGVILAGDIYDKSVPAGEAVQVLDWFLTELSKRKKAVYMVSGNHDSGERLAFGAELMRNSGVHVASIYNGEVKPIVLEDAYGPLFVYLIPFVKPVHVRRALGGTGFGDEAAENYVEAGPTEGVGMKEARADLEIHTYQEAMEQVIAGLEIDLSKRNLLVAHQLVTGASRCDSEDVSVGGLDNINADTFDKFDYVALGHIHGPQSMTKETIRYAGTLLKYSFSECDHKKSITMVELKEKGTVIVETIPVKPLRDMRVMRGTYDELMARDYYKNTNCEDYLKVVLNDEQEVPEALGKLRTVYPNVMVLSYDNERTRNSDTVRRLENVVRKHPLEYFGEFFECQNGVLMDEEQKAIMSDLVTEIWGD
ncbi:MAG: exonuclease SbcCD subunit D [Lachnospiraceae bacterium]|nr:exonuclease SbcCD subunit D [Lachnospiraceae bacterium]